MCVIMLNEMISHVVCIVCVLQVQVMGGSSSERINNNNNSYNNNYNNNNNNNNNNKDIY